MEKDSENANNHQYIFKNEDVFSCVREDEAVICREWELSCSETYGENPLLRRIIKLVAEYGNVYKINDRTLTDELFRELYSLRNEFAITEGYGNYGEFVFENDLKINKEDLFRLMERIKKHIPPVEICERPHIPWAGNSEESFEKIRNLFAKIPCAGEFLEKLIKTGNVNIYGESDHTVFCEDGMLPTVNVSVRGDITDISRFAHEFGHAYGIYLSGKTPDVITSEIHAAVTEAVICAEADKICGQAYGKWHISQKKRSLLRACAVTEAEYDIYSGLKDARRAWREAHEKYGSDTDKDGYMTYEHMWRFPFYNVSYVIAILYILKEYENLSIDKYERLMREISLREIFSQESIL